MEKPLPNNPVVVSHDDSNSHCNPPICRTLIHGARSATKTRFRADQPAVEDFGGRERFSTQTQRKNLMSKPEKAEFIAGRIAGIDTGHEPSSDRCLLTSAFHLLTGQLRPLSYRLRKQVVT